jgi:hypothetical protein
MIMPSIHCHSIVQTLEASRWNWPYVVDAMKILSVMEPFNRTSYCKEGCRTVTKLFNQIALKVHPDKCHSENGRAERAIIKARDAKETLCEANALDWVCKPGEMMAIFVLRGMGSLLSELWNRWE